MSAHADRRRDFAAVSRAAPGDSRAALAALMAEDAAVKAYGPIDRCEGRGEAEERLFRPLASALPDLERRDDILLAGSFEGSEFVAGPGQYAGTFAGPPFYIPATFGLVFLRFGEVHRIRGGTIVESFSHLDLIDLMREAGVSSLPPSLGAEGIFPAASGQCGRSLAAADPAESAFSRGLVEAMIFGGVWQYDGRSLRSMGMERYCTDTMCWYGPSRIGATRGIGEIQEHHQCPFLEPFPDRVRSDRKARFGAGVFGVSTGWPSMRATFAGTWPGCAPSGERITMRVMDVWRREGDRLAENWVFIDIPDVMAQAGIDVFAGRRSMAASR